MRSNYFYKRLWTLVIVCSCYSATVSAQATVAFNADSHILAFGADHIKATAKKAAVVVRITPTAGIQAEGFQLSYENSKILITAIDSVGALYGELEVAEQLRMKNKVTPGIQNPHLRVRAIKFDLPWSPYRTGPVAEQHLEVCRDLKYWRSFLDMMAENRFNVLTLWNVHPFSFMVKPVHFPYANNYTPAEMADWQHFWTTLFRMARERGIAPYIVNWNIAVSPEFAAHYGVRERNDTSAIVKQYTKEVVTQVINEYPDLAGIGITLADWMSNFDQARFHLPVMTPKDREDWITETVIAGIKAAKRPVTLLHRSVLSADPAEMRRVIDQAALPDTTLVEVKFNMSHAFSTPSLSITHDSQSGKVDDQYWNPLPNNYRIQWMVRNEDFFILRWGQADFIRRHIAANTHPYMNGYFVGSEGYIPAKDFSYKPGAYRNWQYAFERQWLFYQLWGRLLYNPATPDAVFAAAFAKKYGQPAAQPLLQAYAAAGNMPLRLASFYAGSWDYTLYSEGFLAPFAGGYHDDVSSFISIDELIDHPVLDPVYVSIKAYVKDSLAAKGKITPFMLADSLQADSRFVLQTVAALRHNASPALICELDDLAIWAHLSAYFAHKLRAGVALAVYRAGKDEKQQQQAVAQLQLCLQEWKQLCILTGKHYQEVPYIDEEAFGGNAFKDARRFSWEKYLPQVERDLELAKK